MSGRVGNFIFIVPEPDAKCEQCGKVDELRPYGKNGMKICYDCAMLDPVETEYQMQIRLFGESEAEARRIAEQTPRFRCPEKVQ